MNHAGPSVLSIVLLAVATDLAVAQSQTWIRQVGTNSYEGARALSPDGAGGIYVGGITGGSLGGPAAGGSDAWFSRRDSIGNQTWMRQIGSSGLDELFGVAPDGSGGAYFAGSTGGDLGGPNSGGWDIWLARYDSIGGQIWIRQFGTSANEVAGTAVPDGSGGVFVAGYTDGSFGGPNAGGLDCWLAHYDGAGNQLWARQIGTAWGDQLFCAAADGSGGLYVCGVTYGDLGGTQAGFGDAWVAHYSSGGSQSWIRQFGTSTSEDYAYSVAADASGGVYVTGYNYGGFGGQFMGGRDAWVARFDTAGNSAWIRQLGTGQDDESYSASSDGLGGVFVAGYTSGSLGGANAGGSDAWIARYDLSGIQTWIRQIGSSGSDDAFAVSSTAIGVVFVGGSTVGNLGAPNAGSADAWFSRYDVPCSTNSSYCTSSTTTNGCSPSIAGTGSASASAPSGFTISVANVEGQKLGLIFYGVDNANWSPLPWASGSTSFLCVKPPTQRTFAQSSGGTTGSCNGSLSIDWNAFIAGYPGALGSPFAGGETVYAQGWFRDPAAPKTTNLSNGLQFSVCP